MFWNFSDFPREDPKFSAYWDLIGNEPDFLYVYLKFHNTKQYFVFGVVFLKFVIFEIFMEYLR